MFSLSLSSSLLNTFVTLAHTRQFTLAARRCNLSQSAFSHAIARLEIEVGAKLFERSTRSVTLTPEGDLLLPVAQRVHHQHYARRSLPAEMLVPDRY